MQLPLKDIDNIIEEIKSELQVHKVSDEQFQQLKETLSNVLENYQKQFPEDSQIQYTIRKIFGRLQIMLTIPGHQMNPLEEGSNAQKLSLTQKISSLLYRPFSDVSYFYALGNNIVTITLPRAEKNRHTFMNPMVLATILGFILGLICQNLPSDVSAFLADDLASPILSVLIKIISGAMGPVIFLSLLTSITTLDNIGELNSHGIRLFRRFFSINIFVSVIAIIIALFLFPIFGQNQVTYDTNMLIKLFLDIFPTNLVSPFMENNVAQIVILGLLMGAALLVINSKTPSLHTLLTEVRDWFNEIMQLVLKLMPAVPFLSIFTLTTRGRFDAIMSGWKYILGTYLCILICISFKLVKVSVVCKINIFTLMKKVSPLFMFVFTAGSETAAYGKFLETSSDSFGIDPDFNSFWYPLSKVLMSPSSSIAFILSCFTVAEITGTPVSLQFMIVLFLVTQQLAFASPGLIPGMTILFQAVGLSTENVGLFSAYSIVIKNFSVAYSATYRILEETESAYVTGHTDSSRK